MIHLLYTQHQLKNEDTYLYKNTGDTFNLNFDIFSYFSFFKIYITGVIINLRCCCCVDEGIGGRGHGEVTRRAIVERMVDIVMMLRVMWVVAGQSGKCRMAWSHHRGG